MALQLRRGTAAERLLSGVVPAPGEFILTTDDNNLYIGDGVTEGGVLVTAKLGGYDVEGTYAKFYLIVNTQRTGGIATFTTDLAHTLSPGDELVITYSPNNAYDGTWTVATTPNSTEFTVNTGGDDLPVEGTAIYMLASAAFTNGAVVKWDDASQQFIIDSLTKADVGLDQVDNTSDLNKPVSTATQAAIDGQLLEEHGDVLVTSLADGQVLVWSQADGAWINGTGGGGGGDASFPDVYYSFAGLGRHPYGQWIGTTQMFEYNAGTSVTAYKAVDVTPILIESLEWDTRVADTSNSTIWIQANHPTGSWCFQRSPQNYYMQTFYAAAPSSQRNSLLGPWIGDQSSSNYAYGKYSWEVDNGVYRTEGFAVTVLGTSGDYSLRSQNYYTLFGTGRPTPALGSSFTFEEFSFVSGYLESYGKFIGPATYETRYANQAAAEADGWTVVQWSLSSGSYYYPTTNPNGDGGVTLPFTFQMDGVTIEKVVFSSSGGLLFLPAGSTAYLYPITNSGTLRYNSDLLDRWAPSVNQYYMALGEVGERGSSSECMYKTINEGTKEAIVFRWRHRVDYSFYAIYEVTIRAQDDDFQVMQTPLYNLFNNGNTIADEIERTAATATDRLKVGYGIVKSGGTYITQNGGLADQFNMQMHPYTCTDGQAKWLYKQTFTASYLTPIFSAMGDVTQGVAGDLLTQTADGYKFVTGTLLGDVLVDTAKVVEASWVYNNLASFVNGNGNYYWYDPASTYIEAQVNRRGADGVDRYSTISAWTSSTVLSVLVNGVSYTLKLGLTPSYNSTYQLFYLRFDYTTYDGADFQAVMSSSANRSNVAYAPTITVYADPADGQVLTYDSGTGKWSPADPAGGGGLSDGDYGDVTVSGSGTVITIDADVVSNTKLANMANGTIKGRSTAGTGDPEDLTAAQVKTILSLNNVENTALSTWTGSTSLTTLGTVGTGTWNATTISIAKGGTGQTTASGAINALLPTQTGNSGKYLTTNGTSASWATVATGATSLNGLSDVTITAAATGEVLRYNGSQWVDAQLAYSDLSGTPTNVSFFTNDAGYLSDVVLDLTPQLGGNLDVNGNYIVSTSDGNVSIAPDGTGLLEVRGNTNDGAIRLNCTANTHGVTIKSPPHAAAATYTLVLPTSAGSVDQVLRTDGSGNLSWVNQSGGAANLNDLGDVTITAASTGEVLRYNGAAWVDAQLAYADLSGAPTNLSQFTNDAGFITDITGENLGDLADVVLTSPVNGNVLSYNGVNWINTAAPPADISGSSIGQLNDVTITSATTGEVLRYNGSAWVDAALDYSDLSGAPSLATVATSGDYNDLINKPTIPVNINDLGDVTITGATTGQILEYNGSAWVNVANSGGGGATSIDDLTDVDTTTVAPANGQVLKWDGSNWVPDNESGGGTFSIDDATDVDTTTATPVVGQVLKWDGANWIPGNDNTGGGGSATLGRGDGGDLDFTTVDSAFVFAVYGGGDLDTTAEDKPVEFVSYDVDGGELT